MTVLSAAAQRRVQMLNRAAARLDLHLSPAPQSVDECTPAEEEELSRLLSLGARIVAYAIANPESSEARVLSRATAREAVQ